MARKTTTTTTTDSRKDSDGNWEEYHRTVVTVVERDDDGYPYGPIQNPFFYPTRRHFKGGAIGDYFAWYNSLGAVPAVKREEKEDGQDG